MKSSVIILLVAFCSCLSPTTALALDKVYKTQQDYLDRKPSMTGTVTLEFYPLMKVKAEDGTKTKFNIKDVWGYEQDETVFVFEEGNKQKQNKVVTFLNRGFGGYVYRCISKGKFCCWVPNTFYLEGLSPGIYSITNMNSQPGEMNQFCCYSTAIDSELIKINDVKRFWGLISEQERDKVIEELKRIYQLKVPQYAIQVYNKFFPAN